MRSVAEKVFKDCNNFRSISGNAEKTSLPDSSVDFITCAQAFHWFPVESTRNEFARILKRGGFVLAVWNVRKTNTKFGSAYEELVRTHCEDYSLVGLDVKSRLAKVESFFNKGGFSSHTCDYDQSFDYNELKGFLESASYAPTVSHPKYQLMIKKLKEIFETNVNNGTVRMEYSTELYYGNLE